MKAYAAGTHLNCHNLLEVIQMRTHNEVIRMSNKNIIMLSRQKYIGCNLKTMKLLDCALIGVCAMIRSNTVCTERRYSPGPSCSKLTCR